MTYAELKARARHNRKNPTKSEKLLWGHLRNRKLGGLKFRRQHLIYPFIVDFCCVSRSLIIEIDGEYHDTESEHETRRQKSLEKRGYKVVRFTNKDILELLPTVLDLIFKCT